MCIRDRYYYGDVSEVIKVSEDKVKFVFSTNTNKELPLIVGQLPVLPKHYWEDKNFEETTLYIPIGSGPYKIKSFDAGRLITYELNEGYWGFQNNVVPIKVPNLNERIEDIPILAKYFSKKSAINPTFF